MIKKGDKLICIRACDELILNKEYEAACDEFDYMVRLVGYRIWYANRFRLKQPGTFRIPEDLKTGMLVEFANGKIALVMKDTEDGDNYVSDSCNVSAHHWSPIRESKETPLRIYAYNTNAYGACVSIKERRLLHEFERPKEIQLTSQYNAIINIPSSTVKVGCQTITFDKVEELYNEIKKHK